MNTLRNPGYEVCAADYFILAGTIYGEARGEDFKGKIAVGVVIRNRFLTRKYKGDHTITATCLRYMQFSCWNMDDPNRAKIFKALNCGDWDDDMSECADAAHIVLGWEDDKDAPSTHKYYCTQTSAINVMLRRINDYYIAEDFLQGATHYHTKAMGWPPAWGTKKIPVAQVGCHLFYNNVA